MFTAKRCRGCRQAGRQAAERKPNGRPVSHMQAGQPHHAGRHGKKPKPDPDPRPTDPPPPNAKSLSPEAPASWSRYVTPTLLPSDSYIWVLNLKDMAQKIKVHGKSADMSGLRVVGGRLINDSPTAMAPVTQAAIMRKERMRQEKIDMMATAYHRAEMQHEMMEMMNGKYKDMD